MARDMVAFGSSNDRVVARSLGWSVSGCPRSKPNAAEATADDRPLASISVRA